MDKKHRIILLGLDGATFDVILPMVNKGELPGFTKILEQGSYATLRSTVPPMTAPAWVSATTGKNPGKHGVYDFWTPPTSEYERYIVNTTNVKSLRIWDILGNSGKKSIVFNVPVTYPPAKINGVMMSGMLTPDMDYGWTYPPSLKDHIMSMWKNYSIDPGWTKEDTRDPLLYLERILNTLETRRQILEYMMDKHPWDFCMVVFVALDRVQHFFWRFFDNTHPCYEPRAQQALYNAIPTIYKKVDEIIQWIVSFLHDEDQLFVISDHGFGKLEYELYIYKWLEQEGFTSFASKNVHNPTPQQQGLIKGILEKWFPNRNLASNKQLQEKPPLDNPVYTIGKHLIDWSKTKVFFGTDTDSGIYINLKEKFSKGTVEQGTKYNNLRHILKEKLLELRDSKGEQLIETVYFKEDIYSGEFLHNAPDLVLKTKNSNGMLMELHEYKKLVVPAKWRNGIHRDNAIFIARGKNIRQGFKLKDLSMYDVVPTIMYCYHMDIPSDMDGKVAEELFIENHRYDYKTNQEMKTNPQENKLSIDEQEKIKNRLKSLGYLD